MHVQRLGVYGRPKIAQNRRTRKSDGREKRVPGTTLGCILGSMAAR